jgi:5,10-methenyltetrahydrofolate synthetase
MGRTNRPAESSVTGDRAGKSSLRRAVLKRRDAMDAGTRAILSRAIVDSIVGLDGYHQSGVVLAYSSFGSELQTAGFLRHVLDDGKTLVLPRVNRERRLLDLHEVRDPARDLEAGTWGIREPRPDRCPRVEPEAIDFVVVPGVGFDPRGGRLGYGGGYYDRLLAGYSNARPLLVAGAFEIQMVEEVPVEEHDTLMNLIVTERKHYDAAGRHG